ncbi:hypothetical protein BDP27DRAFT_1425134 [Rhodocollybia butyracea]|uniref:F-box domain-containing protein n=1 Tax=Rhodocollybia butyracea TaxID=206335 RepID=A0A9P5PKI9_9AGAR|nr:hypothetical protein BDP27DRAFT_1425134 [Rhodocollybia butyracea]
MSFPAALTLAGIDPFLSQEQFAAMRRTFEKEQRMIDGLDEQITQAKAALERLLRQRNEKRAPSLASTTRMLAIRKDILEREVRLELLEEEISKATESNAAAGELVAQKISSEPATEHAQSQARIAQLQLERDRLQADLEALRVELSPIRRIPLEILSEIFVHCLPVPRRTGFSVATPSKAPLLLSQICRRWRSVAISIPKLWSSLSIQIKDRCYPNISLVQTFLDRSLLHPFSFRLKESLVSNTDLSLTPAVFELLLKAYHRWQDVEIRYSDWRIDDTSLLKIPASPPSTLESLTLERAYWSSNLLGSIRTLLSAPGLRKISWSGLLQPHSNPADIMPLELLREFSLPDPCNLLTKTQFMRNLHRAPQLVSCTMTVLLVIPHLADPHESDDFVLPDKENPLVFSDLKKLDITCDTAVEQIFDVLVLPSLKTLEISHLDNAVINAVMPAAESPRFWSMPSFKALHQRSCFSLHTLDLADTDVQPDELLQILQLCSTSLHSLSLTNDHISSYCVDDHVLQALTLVPECHQLLCPSLTNIKLWACMSSTDGLVSDMLESRWGISKDDPTIHELQVALIMFKNDELHPKDHRRLKVLSEKRAGLTVIKWS